MSESPHRPSESDETRESPRREIYTVSRLNREARAHLEAGFPLLWVEGELSNVARPSSGHLYFSLKDAHAQARCAMFRNRNLHLRFRPENGQQVLVRARVSLYEPRGEYQLIAEHMEESGYGALQRAFEALKQRLAAEGLFDPVHKRPLPLLPRRIGVITSPTGAAIRDILSVLGRRFPALPVLIYPVPVQGEGAAERIARAIERADQRRDCDVLLVARGGGSLEDLWAFNEERVARAIHACGLPVCVGVGHEVDVTIADFVADERAPTPSAAAERLSPDRGEWLQTVDKLGRRLRHGLGRHLEQAHQRLAWVGRRLQQQHPGVRLRQHGQRLDEFELRLVRAQNHQLRHRQGRLAHARSRLAQHTPGHRIEALQQHCVNLRRRLETAARLRLERPRQRLDNLGRALDAVSPLATLDRGYAIVTRKTDNRIVRRAAEVEAGSQVQARLARGVLVCTVDETQQD